MIYAFQLISPAVRRHLILATLLLAVISQLPAQLNGTYTIGGDSPDYPYISAAVAALESEGVSGPVTFLIRPGRYFTHVTLRQVSGSSKYNTITFRSESGDSDDVMLASTAYRYEDNYVLKFDNARYYRIRGLTIYAESTDFPGTIKVVNEAFDLQIDDCEIVAENAWSGDLNQAAISIIPSVSSKIYLRNNTIYGGSHGIYYAGSRVKYSTDTRISGNTVRSFYLTGITLNNLTGGELNSNFIGVWRLRSGAKGLVMRECNGNFYRPMLVANNMVTMLDGVNPTVGIYGSSYIQFFHNSLNNDKGRNLVEIADTRNLAVLNNVLRAGSGFVADVKRTTDLSMDYNDLISSGYSFGIWEGRTIGTFSKWKLITGKDQHSISIDPQYGSLYDLHARASGLIGAGTPVAAVSTDIDGESRSNPPCIGADEFKLIIKFPWWYPMLSTQSVEPVAAAAGEDAEAKQADHSVSVGEHSIFPSPASDRLNVSLTDAYTGHVILTVMDGLGRRVSTVSYEKEGADLRAELAVSDLVPGVYLLQIEEGSDVSVKRFVKR